MQKAKKDNIKVAYAIDSFELWYLLHFDYLENSMHRDDINIKLIEKLKKKNKTVFLKLNENSIKQKSL